jgi:hypothetical protein
MTVPTLKRKWFQFSLRTLLVFVTLVAVLCSWLTVKRQQARRQWEAKEEVYRLRGEVKRYLSPIWPDWLRELLRDEFFEEIYFVGLSNTKVTDTDMGHLTGLSQLEDLDLGHTQVTDAGLVNLRGLYKIERLNLNDTRVTDVGLEHLKVLNRLQALWLGGTQITDAGLECLSELNQLQELHISRTKVTDEGVKKLQRRLPRCKTFQ